MRQGLPVVNAKQLTAALVKAGFEIRRQTGSHVIMYKSGIPHPVSVPQHSGDLPKGTTRAIIRQSGLTVVEFLGFL